MPDDRTYQHGEVGKLFEEWAQRRFKPQTYYAIEDLKFTFVSLRDAFLEAHSLATRATAVRAAQICRDKAFSNPGTRHAGPELNSMACATAIESEFLTSGKDGGGS